MDGRTQALCFRSIVLWILIVSCFAVRCTFWTAAIHMHGNAYIKSLGKKGQAKSSINVHYY